MWGVAPTRRVPFVSAKGTKTISARARPQGGPSASAPNKMARELAPLKQPSPRSRFGAAAPPHPTREPIESGDERTISYALAPLGRGLG